MMERIKDIADPKKIDIIVANHVEKDHSGRSADAHKDAARVYSFNWTEAAVTGFGKHYDTMGWNFKTIKSLDKLDLGGKTLVFVEAPMLHWPDSMFMYLAEDKILFPNDAFGQHIASRERFDDELGKEASLAHAQKFFANLITPLAPKVLKKLDEVTKLGIPISMVAPSHGIIWRSYAGDIPSVVHQLVARRCKEQGDDRLRHDAPLDRSHGPDSCRRDHGRRRFCKSLPAQGWAL